MAIELELDGGPTAGPRITETPLTRAIAACRAAHTREALEAAIIPARSWPEGPDKAKLRTELRIAETRLRTEAEQAARQAAAMQAAKGAQHAALDSMWSAIWRGMAGAIFTDGGVLKDHRPAEVQLAEALPGPAGKVCSCNPSERVVISGVCSRCLLGVQAEEVQGAEGQASQATEPASEPASTLQGALGEIVAQGAHNATQTGMAALGANGLATLGVGFSNAEGYIEALRRGAPRATFESYAGTLRSRYGMTVAISYNEAGTLATVNLGDGRSFTSQVLQMTSGTGGPSVDSHASDAGIAKMKARAAGRVAVPDPSRAEVRAAITGREIVVGAQEAGSGVLLGWAGLGEHTLPGIRAALTRAGLPETWAPNSRSAHAHAAAALTTLTTSGRILRSERGRRARSTTWIDGTPRSHVARWTVGNPTHGSVGDAMGIVALSAGLTSDGQLDLTGDTDLVNHVRAEFNRRVDSEVYPAGEVTYWLRAVLVTRFAAVRLGANWYVPARHATPAERLCEELARGWGADWILPALPVATTNQLRAGLVRGLASDADAVLAEFEMQRASARADRPGGDIGPRAAATLLGKVKDIYQRSASYREMLGSEYVAGIRTKLEEVIGQIEPLCDASVSRFAMLDLV